MNENVYYLKKNRTRKPLYWIFFTTQRNSFIEFRATTLDSSLEVINIIFLNEILCTKTNWGQFKKKVYHFNVYLKRVDNYSGKCVGQASGNFHIKVRWMGTCIGWIPDNQVNVCDTIESSCLPLDLKRRMLNLSDMTVNTAF